MLTIFLITFGKAVLAGLAIAAPVGPVGVMCVQRTLHHGRVAGLVSGLGAALADAMFGIVAAFGVVAVADWMVNHQTILELVGGALLIGIGLRALMTRAAEKTTAEPRGHLAAFASTFVLTITNPITILAFAAVFASLGLGVEELSMTDAAILVGGVFVGSALWWCGIAASAGLLRAKLGDNAKSMLNGVAGVIIIAFGCVALVAGLV